MKQIRQQTNGWLTLGLEILYGATYLLSFLTAAPITLIDYLATAGVTLGVWLFLRCLPRRAFTTTLCFCFLAQYGGMMLNGYHRFIWYDLAVHFFSGFVLAMLGSYLCRALLKKEGIRSAPLLIGVFSILTALAGAGLWEIYEYGIDSLFGMVSQQGVGQQPLDDTMQDMIAGGISGILYGVISAVVLRLRKNHRPTF